MKSTYKNTIIEILNQNFEPSSEFLVVFNMPRRGSRLKCWPCDFCSESFPSEWAKISHSSNDHQDLNDIFSLILEDQKNDGALTDLTQFYDPSSLDIKQPQK